MINSILIHTDEIALKGNNRSFFERLLLENILLRLRPIAEFVVRSRKGTVVLRAAKSLSDEEQDQIATQLKTVFGIAHFFFCAECPPELGEIKKTAVEMVSGKSGSFRVTARRGDKQFAVSSIELAREIGAEVLVASRGQMKVDLHQPETTIFVVVNFDGAFVALERHDGPGGLPTGSAGKVVAMLSGGIDSPVAAHKVMSRGCRAVLVHFHSYPHVGRESIEKVKRLAAIIDRYQLHSRLYLVPLADIQREMTVKTDGAMRVILYRRAMLRLAEAIAHRERALGLVTGDSISQVASQTLENLLTVSAVAQLPIYRPLVGDDKKEIIRAAEEIGTYKISIEPHDDCCTLFVPVHPELHSTPRQAEAEEAKLDLDQLMAAALKQAEIIDF